MRSSTKRTDNPWTIKSSRVAYENRWMRIREDSVVTPTGQDGMYAVLESNNSVMVVVLNKESEVYLIHKFRYPDQSWNWELPGGGGDKQDPVTASKRELEEETGLRAGTWKKLGETLVDNGFMTEKMSTYLARDISLTGKKETSDEQISQSAFFSLAEIDSMIDKGDINDCQSITGLFLLHRWLDKNKS